MDESILYGDLDLTDAGSAKAARVQELEAENEKLKEELRTAQLMVENYEKRCATLEQNISSLYETAKAEVDRKDARIAGLLAELEAAQGAAASKAGR
mmetsp:Transcript_3417/g.13571  ORF Transcript_3417/g.13571 Transcript_3417/m.13571 type:complete len:97 (-) Transcript_3417:1007-1297(-)